MLMPCFSSYPSLPNVHTAVTSQPSTHEAGIGYLSLREQLWLWRDEVQRSKNIHDSINFDEAQQLVAMQSKCKSCSGNSPQTLLARLLVFVLIQAWQPKSSSIGIYWYAHCTQRHQYWEHRSQDPCNHIIISAFSRQDGLAQMLADNKAAKLHWHHLRNASQLMFVLSQEASALQAHCTAWDCNAWHLALCHFYSENDGYGIWMLSDMMTQQNGCHQCTPPPSPRFLLTHTHIHTHAAIIPKV